MTKIGYRFINWALLFLAGFIVYEFNRNIDDMEGIVVSECLKSDGYTKDFHFIDLDDSFMYALIEKNDDFKIGDKVKIEGLNETIMDTSYGLQAVPLIIIAIACVVVALFRAFIALDDLNYRYLKD